MDMIFDYYYVEQSMGSVEIQDIGNFALNITNDDYNEWFMCITTDMGWTTVKTFGPLKVDFNFIDNYFSYTQFKLEYNEKKIISNISKFINDKKKQITQAQEVSFEDFHSRLQGVADESSN